MPNLRACPKCRALLEPGTRTCPYCGVRPGRAAPPPPVQTEAGKTSRLGLWVIGVNVAIYALMILLDPSRGDPGVRPFEPSRDILLAFGMSETWLVSTCGQYWRLLASVFLHLDVMHLLFNCVAIYILVSPAAATLGPYRAAAIYLPSGFLAALASHLAGNSGAGASGAVCALIAALVVFGQRRGGELGRQLSRSMARWAFLIIAFGFFVPNVDNVAHLAGFASGALLGWPASAARVFGGIGERIWRGVAYLSLAVTVAVAAVWMAPSIARSFERREVELYHSDAQRVIRLLAGVVDGKPAELPESFPGGPARSADLTEAVRKALALTRRDPRAPEAGEACYRAWQELLAWERRLGCSHAMFWRPE